MKVKISNLKKMIPKQPKPPKGGGEGGKQPEQPKNTETFEDQEEDEKDSEGQEQGEGESEQESPEQKDGEGEGENDSTEGESEKAKGRGKAKDGEEKGEGDEEGKTGHGFDEHIIDPENAPEALEVPSEDPNYTPKKSTGKTDKEISEEQERAREDVSRVAKEIRAGGEGRSDSGGGGESIFKKKYTQTKTDWKKILRDFIEKQYKMEEIPNRPERVFQSQRIFIPATRKVRNDESLNLVVALDTSGSVSPPILNTFISELSNIVKSMSEVKLSIMLFTDHVYAEVDIDTRKSAYSYTDTRPPVQGVKYFRATSKNKDEIKSFLFNSVEYKSGGTVLSSVTRHLQQRQMNRLSGFLVFTDGDTESNPTLPNSKKNIFLINKGGRSDIVRRFGQVYEIDVDYTY
jgi:hypothetical protein